MMIKSLGFFGLAVAVESFGQAYSDLLLQRRWCGHRIKWYKELTELLAGKATVTSRPANNRAHLPQWKGRCV